MLGDDLERRKRAGERAKTMVLHKGRVGTPELDLSPIRGDEAISLATRLTLESFSLAGDNVSASRTRGEGGVRFVPRRRP